MVVFHVRMVTAQRSLINIISSTARTINLKNIKQGLCFAMNIKIKGKGNLISDVYVNTSVATIWNNLAANNSVAVTSNEFV